MGQLFHLPAGIQTFLFFTTSLIFSFSIQAKIMSSCSFSRAFSPHQGFFLCSHNSSLCGSCRVRHTQSSFLCVYRACICVLCVCMWHLKKCYCIYISTAVRPSSQRLCKTGLLISTFCFWSLFSFISCWGSFEDIASLFIILSDLLPAFSFLFRAFSAELIIAFEVSSRGGWCIS